MASMFGAMGSITLYCPAVYPLVRSRMEGRQGETLQGGQKCSVDGVVVGMKFQRQQLHA